MPFLFAYLGPLKACHLWQPVRKFSSLAHVRSPFKKFTRHGFDLPVSEGFLRTPSTSFLGRREYATLIQLEERANDEYDNAQAQARYMEVCVRRACGLRLRVGIHSCDLLSSFSHRLCWKVILNMSFVDLRVVDTQ